MSVEGTIFRIERFAIHDGPGIRTTVFFKGCPLRCAWCHSPESQRLEPEFMPQPGRCIRCGACTEACPRHAVLPAAIAETVAPESCTTCGACARACPSEARELVGRTIGARELVVLIERDRIFFDESGGGVTFSGGEPLLQPAFLIECARECRDSGIRVAVETCGLADTAALLEAASHTDLFLFDLKAVDEDVHLALTGASNRRIIANLERLAAAHPRVVVRFPLVPGVNSNEGDLGAMGALLSSLRLTRVDILPYHRAGISKYERLRRPYLLGEAEPPSAALQARAALTLESYGLLVRTGGSS